ncbi:hypothetical protein GCK72_020648 [Caenorhabditis remanei]|uniref:Uncharacterized protein n=1 Tax=Caenorhabditis remanei TaxID=31234 RepID=A0A6A5GG29_CAERE|nr:hypothetical protein GCK72_020648 [Caenorhabditis remanei]KAF1754090.1 hypothetical protein GCK72_020648 [Caenorhabditis remanei]
MIKIIFPMYIFSAYAEEEMVTMSSPINRSTLSEMMMSTDDDVKHRGSEDFFHCLRQLYQQSLVTSSLDGKKA